MIAAHEYVRNNMKWDGRNRIYTTKTIREAFEKKSGSSADINLMLVALLKEIGIDCDPVMISTRSNGMINPAIIMTSQFNYVAAMAKIGEKTYILDATEKMCPYYVLPERCINGQGRIVSESKPGWTDLNTTQKHEYTNMTNVAISADGTLSGKVQRMFVNYAAVDQRNEIKARKDHDEYVRELENDFKGLTIKSFELLDVDSLSKPYMENLEVDIAGEAQVTGNLISFTPLLYDQWESNPFKLEIRSFPVDFVYPRIERIVMIYQIPEGYALDEKPADMILSMPGGETKFTYRLVQSGNQLQVSSTLNIGRAMYIDSEYAQLKLFFEKMVSKQAEKIVLKKAI